MKPKSLFTQILVTVVAIIILTNVFFAYFTAKSSANRIYQEISRQSEQLAKSLSHICADFLLTNDFASLESLLLRFVALPDILAVQVIDSKSNIISEVIKHEDQPPKVIFGNIQTQTPKIPKTTTYPRGDALYVFEPIIVGEHIGWVKVTHSLSAIKKAQQSTWLNTTIATIIGIVISSVLIAIVLRNPLKRIKLLSDFAKNLNEQKGSQIDVGGTSIEIRQLNQSLNYASQTLKEAEKELVAQQEYLKVTLYSIGDGVIVTDKQGKVVLLNRVAEQLTGYFSDEAVGRNLTEVFNIINEKTGKAAENPVEKVLETGKIQGLANHTALIAKDGTKRSIADSAAPIVDRQGNIYGVVMVFRDVTEAQLMQEELIKAKKLESLGVLAGGIAHDFNNALTAIVGNISMAMNFLDPNDKVYNRLQKAEKASERAMFLAKQLLTFSRGGAPVLKTEALNTIISDTVHFLSRGSDIKYHLDIPEDLWLADVDITQFSQVLQNVIINAQQAMPSGGELRIKAENLYLNKQNILPLEQGRYIKIAIKDTGHGIAPEHLQRVFDPYFTTKSTGCGLGLAIAYSIVKRHNGHISIASEIGVGTTVEIYIPASTEKHKEDEANKNIAEDTHKGLKILVMDDEEDIRDISKQMLEHLGNVVTVCAEGTEAVRLYKEALRDSQPFDLVILDIVVPGGVGGKDALNLLREIDPDVKAIVSSGYSNDPIVSNYKHYGFRSAIQKPYKIKDLKTALKESFC